MHLSHKILPLYARSVMPWVTPINSLAQALLYKGTNRLRQRPSDLQRRG
jgi:hypothetical protein